MTRAVMTEYWEAIRRQDLRTMDRLRHRDWSAHWPQSGERVTSSANDLKIHENYPGYPVQEVSLMAGAPAQWTMSPLLVPLELTKEGDYWASSALFSYPDGQYHMAGIFELRDGLVWRETQYWAKVMEP